MRGPKNLTEQEKLEIVLKGLTGGKTTKQICQEHQITPTLFYLLRRQAYQGMLESLKPKKRGRKMLRGDPEKKALIRANQKLLKEKMQVEHLLSMAQRTLSHRKSQSQLKAPACRSGRSDHWVNGGKKDQQPLP